MRTVMVVDDESLVRIGLQSMIDWEANGYKLTGAYRNGAEALAAAAAMPEPPDIVLTDIRMPEMDGFALIQELKRLSPRTHILILSSYEDFAYTRQAIQLGVKDYIPKHRLEPDELIRVLNALPREEGGLQPSGASPPDRTEEDKSALLAATKAAFSGASEAIASAPEELPEFLSRYGSPPDSAYCWVALRTDRQASTAWRALSFLAQETFGRFCGAEWLGISDGTAHLLAIDAQGMTGGEPGFASHVEASARGLLVSAVEKLNLRLTVGISLSCRELGALRARRAEAEASLRRSFYQGHGVYAWSAEKALRKADDRLWIGCSESLQEYLWKSDYEGLLAWFGAEAARLDRTEPEDAMRYASLVARRFADHLLERYRLVGGAEPDMQQAAAWADVVDAVQRGIADGIRQIGGQTGASAWMARIREHIERHYAQQLRLEDLAGLVNFSENYISQRFHQEMGCSFMEYLTRVRIRKAVELYGSSDMSTEEIASRVGYPNANYFIKVFKKVTGRTLSAFKQQAKNWHQSEKTGISPSPNGEKLEGET